MKKKNLYFIILNLLLVIILFVVGINTVPKISDSMLDIKKIGLSKESFMMSGDYDYSYLKKYFNIDDIISFEELKNKSEVIVKVKAEGKRILYNKATKTHIKILEIYKGNELNINDIISIYEPISCNKEVIFSDGGYNFLNDEDEYVLFLNHLTIPDGYKFKYDEKSTYIPTTLKYSKYNVKCAKEETKCLKFLDVDNQDIDYKRICNYEIFTTNKKILKHFYALKNKVLKLGES